MLKIQAPNPPVLPRTKSALASTRAMPHCQHPTFAHPGRNFSTLSIFSGWGIQPLAEVADLLADALAISLKTIGCRFYQRGFFSNCNSNKGKGSLTSGRNGSALLRHRHPNQCRFFGGLPHQTTELVPAYFGHQKTSIWNNVTCTRFWSAFCTTPQNVFCLWYPFIATYRMFPTNAWLWRALPSKILILPLEISWI